jgi:hypothetical protein
MKAFCDRNMSLIPRHSIEFLVNRLHMSTPDAEVEAALRQRMVTTNPPARVQKMVVRYALSVHHKNQKLYDFVTGGIR